MFDGSLVFKSKCIVLSWASQTAATKTKGLGPQNASFGFVQFIQELAQGAIEGEIQAQVEENVECAVENEVENAVEEAGEGFWRNMMRDKVLPGQQRLQTTLRPSFSASRDSLTREMSESG